jgi:DNA-binding NtrC family response regulator
VVVDGIGTLDIRVPDGRMSAKHARLERRNREWTVTDLGSTNGSRVRGRRVDHATLSDGDVLELGQTLFRFREALPTPVKTLGDRDAAQLEGLVAAFGTLTPIVERDLDILQRVARSNGSVLLQGETGTGKEVLARAVHAYSKRKGPFVAVNCGALPAGLVESLLFGHKKGSFSGATAHELGFVRAAHGGTLFLDEVGDLPPASQAVLLRVLQEHEVVPIGATRPIATDIRVIAATHRSLPQLIQTGRFRNDLYARLAEHVHVVPSLRDRIEDVGVLLSTILPRVAPERAASLTLTANAARELVEHKWPMNVRELEQRLKMSVVLADGDRIELAPCPDMRAPMDSRRPPSAEDRAAADEEDVLYEELVARIAEHRGNLTHVARAMGKARTQIHRWCRRFGIDPSQYRLGN